MTDTPTPRPALTTLIIDRHGQDGPYDLEAFARAGGVALWFKATEGKDFRDKGFVDAMRRAKACGVLPGAYHYGSSSSPGASQADYFLATVRAAVGEDLGGVLLALDLEEHKDPADTMTLDDAAAFVARVHEVTGRWPVFYSYTSFIDAHFHRASAETTATLAKCPLWLAQYSDPPRRVPGPWKAWWLWQYSDWKFGPTDRTTYPRVTPGMGPTDRSAFRGSADELRAMWPTLGVDPAP